MAGILRIALAYAAIVACILWVSPASMATLIVDGDFTSWDFSADGSGTEP